MLKLKMVSGEGIGAVGRMADCPRRILVVVMGEGSALVGGVGRVSFGPGSVFLLEQGVSFSVHSGEVELGHFLCLDSGYVDYFLLQYPLGRGLGLFGGLVSLVVPVEHMGLVLERVRVLGAEVERGAGFDHLKLLFSLFLFDVVGDRFVLAEPFDLGRRLFGEFTVLLEGNFRSQRGCGLYADRLNVSMRKLNMLCRGWYEGRIFEVVLRERLLSEAEYLLLGSDEAIKVISMDLGFYSPQHFRHYFKKFRGVGPLAFRLAGKREG